MDRSKSPSRFTAAIRRTPCGSIVSSFIHPRCMGADEANAIAETILKDLFIVSAVKLFPVDAIPEQSETLPWSYSSDVTLSSSPSSQSSLCLCLFTIDVFLRANHDSGGTSKPREMSSMLDVRERGGGGGLWKM